MVVNFGNSFLTWDVNDIYVEVVFIGYNAELRGT